MANAIAHKTRQWAMQNRHRWDFPSDLEGMCGIASCQLWYDLDAANINAKIACNQHHAFVLLKDDIIIDITASQFGYCNVEVLLPNDARRNLEHWVIKDIFEHPEDFISYQMEEGWPHEQIYERN